jgi:hypothetical protein
MSICSTGLSQDQLHGGKCDPSDVQLGATDRAGGDDLEPLAVTFRVAVRITGLGNTTLWKFGKEGRIELIRPPGARRTLIAYRSLKKLLSPQSSTDTPLPRRRRRPRKRLVLEATT